MFRSFGSSLLSLLIVILTGMLVLFVWTGSEAITFKRVALDRDLTLEGWRVQEENKKPKEVPSEPKMVETATDSKINTVLWLSIPGFRPDYVKNADTSFFDKMISEGAETKKFKPLFPCLTYPSHITSATGVPVAIHGIASDVIRKDGKSLKDSVDSSLLIAEPIWLTATKQDRRVIVHDWPLSQNQGGDNAAAHFLTEYDSSLTDQQRLDKLMEVWMADKGEKKIRLVMARLNSINDAGRQFGPRAEDTYTAMSALDKTLDTFFTQLQEKWKDLSNPGDNLAVIITTDHGVAEVTKNVNLPAFMGEVLSKRADFLVSEAIGHVYFKDLPDSDAAKNKFYAAFDRQLNSATFWRAYKREELPADWKYNAPENIGDRVLVLRPKYSFTEVTSDEALFEPALGEGFVGSWGYPVEESSRMQGQVVIWGFPNGSPATGDLGEINNLSFHPTVCKLLGIKPSKDATEEPLPVQ